MAAVGDAAHAFVFMHIATNKVSGLRESENKRGKEKRQKQKQKEDKR